jgi:hypothetical protein
VLPLCLDDFERFALLLHPSLVKYGRGLVRRCLVVTPDKDFDEILRRCPSGPYEVLAESTIAPGLRDETAPGWRRQQIVKLTVAELVETRFYLTLDADVMFTRQIGYGDVTRDGRAWFCVRRTGVHADWLRWSERVLLRRGDGAHYAVTPSILATECVHRLLAHIVSLPAPAGRPRWPDAATALLARWPWTEYTLYGIYATSEGLLETHHWLRPIALYGNSLWRGDDLAAWDPAQSFTPDSRRFFTVIQSNAGFSPDAVLQRVAPYLT